MQDKFYHPEIGLLTSPLQNKSQVRLKWQSIVMIVESSEKGNMKTISLRGIVFEDFLKREMAYSNLSLKYFSWYTLEDELEYIWLQLGWAGKRKYSNKDKHVMQKLILIDNCNKDEEYK